MSNINSNPVTVNGTGADSQNQVIRLIAYTLNYDFSYSSSQVFFREVINKEGESDKKAIARTKKEVILDPKNHSHEGRLMVENLWITKGVRIRGKFYVKASVQS